MANGFYEAMKRSGFSYETTASVKKYKCPYCGFEFSLVYARAFACQGCSEAVRGCPKVRCCKCDAEFFIEKMGHVHGKEQQRRLSDHICDIVSEYHRDMGRVPNR
ncbi:MAG: hypothetical protein LBT41_04565 [Candidatus Methanoplasma sp.]|jgi:DNA-directed RNA polymerase subunit RPC12/RpoP|nr:hypothetical protein [Candidatus Methanoplasma sp.]